MRRHQQLAAAIAVAAVLLLTRWRLEGPSPKGTAAPRDEFSAGRAIAVLRELLREGVPHPVGSPANVRVRDRILARFTALGYQANVQKAFVCNASRTCATVENIIANPAGMTLHPVVLAAHYDSVAAGPGASDDGVGVAVLLEIARAVRGDRRVAFVITDGEEAGLLGAEAFVRDRPIQPAAIVNVENRGGTGPSYLFETSRGNHHLIAAARAMPRPITTSLFFTVYDQLPNDTDVTVFKRVGIPSVNFAAIGSVEWYHTPQDDLRHVDPRSVQHHGDNALAITRALVAKPAAGTANASWFDVLGFTIVSWPQAWTIWITLLAIIILVRLNPTVKPRTYAAGVIAFVAVLVLTVIAAYALIFLSHLGSDGANWLAYPHSIWIAMWLTGFAAAVFVTRWLENDEAFAAYAFAWLVAALILAVTLPGASYLLLVPALLFAVTRLPIVWTVAAAVLVVPFALVLYTALGRLGLTATAVLVAITSTTVAPLVSRSRRALIAVASAALLGAVVTPLLPTYSRAKPRRESITHELPRSTVQLTARQARDRLIVTVRSLRKANQVTLFVPPDIVIDRINGMAPAPRNPRGGRRTNIATVYGRTAIFEMRAPRKIEVNARDLAFGVPPAVARRRGRHGVPSGRGDVTISVASATF
jgi:hypothetical protein